MRYDYEKVVLMVVNYMTPFKSDSIFCLWKRILTWNAFSITIRMIWSLWLVNHRGRIL